MLNFLIFSYLWAIKISCLAEVSMKKIYNLEVKQPINWELLEEETHMLGCRFGSELDSDFES